MSIKYLIPVFIFISFNAIAQKASDKTIKATCDCVGKVSASLPVKTQDEKMIECFTNSFIANFEGLKKEYKIKSTDEEEVGEEIGKQLGLRLATECPKMMPMFLRMAGQTDDGEDEKTEVNIKDTLTLDPTVCKKYREGKYYTERMFMGNKELPDQDKSDYSEIKGNTVTDYSEGGKYITKWTITFTSDCEWKETLVESNYPSLNAILKKGDVMTIKAVGSTPSGGLYLETSFAGMEFIVLVRK